MNKLEYAEFIEIIKKKSGINLVSIDYTRISRLVNEREKISGCKSFHEYIKYLGSGSAENEWEELLQKITISETYFFRDTSQCNALKDYILPRLIKFKKDKKIRVWSAGCSTGEEAYTIAIILNQRISDIKSWDIRITGTDINRKSIETARNGFYGKNSFRGVDDEIIDRYFIKKGRRLGPKGFIKRDVQFEIFNMKIGEKRFFPSNYMNFDIIFCRNVLVYFEKKDAGNILKGFNNSLLHKGYLVLGHSEASLAARDLFTPVRTKDTFIYAPIKIMPSDKRPNKPKISGRSKLKPGIKQKSVNNKRINLDKRIPVKNPVEPVISLRNVNISYVKEALSLYFNEKYMQAGEKIDNFLAYSNAGTEELLLASLISINLGDFEKALSLVRQIRQKDEFLPDSHFIYGLIHENGKNYEKAIRAYKAALFLDGDYFFSYFRLGHLYHKTNRKIDSARAFRTALTLIGRQDDERVRLLSGGFTKKNLEDICRKVMK